MLLLLFVCLLLLLLLLLFGGNFVMNACVASFPPLSIFYEMIS